MRLQELFENSLQIVNSDAGFGIYNPVQQLLRLLFLANVIWIVCRPVGWYPFFSLYIINLAHAIMNCPSCVFIVQCCCCHHCLWKVLLARGLITETSYLVHIHRYTPRRFTWNIRSIWPIFLNRSHFSFLPFPV